MRRSLTNHKIPFKQFMVLPAIVLLDYLVFRIFPKQLEGSTSLVSFLGLVFIIGLILSLYSVIPLLEMWTQKWKIEFDEVNMYIIRNGRESSIPLKNINKISNTSYGIRSRGSEWTIYFTDNFNEMVYVSSWYIQPKGEIVFFKTNVRRQNPSVEIKEWVTSREAFLDSFKKRG